MSGGANCPETPRQKMIGMMYLFLTAMLALNVSKSILHAFITVNEGLEKTNENFEATNKQRIGDIDFAYAQDKLKVQKYKEAADKIQEETEKMVVFIDTLKKDVINLCDNPEDPIYGDTVNLAHVHGIDNYDKPGHYFLGNSSTTGETTTMDGAGGRAPEFRQKMDDYRAFLVKTLKGIGVSQKDLDQIGDFGINTADNENFDREHPEEKYWASANFEHNTLAATVTILSQFENQIRNAEGIALIKVGGYIGKTDMKFDKLEARVVPKSTYVIQGSDYEADLFVAAWSSTSKPKVIVGPANQLDTINWVFKAGADTTVCPVINGVGKYKRKGSSLGEQKYASIIEVKNTSTGETKTYPLKVEGDAYATYMVAKPAAVISPTKMNVFYIGVPNPVSISVPGFAAEKISPSMRGGSIRAKNKGKGEYLVNVKKRGKCYISVTAIDDNGNKTSFPKQEFRVKKVPDPIAKVAGVSSGSISKNKMAAVSGVKADLEGFDFDMKAMVTGFTVTATIGGYDKSKTSNSYKFTAAQKKIIKSVRKGSRVTIEKIKCKVAGGIRPLRDISLKLK